MSGVVIASAVAEYQRLCGGAAAVAFCVDIAHSRETAAAFLKAGVRAAHIDGQTPAEERRELIASLGDGRLDVLCNCGLISEGLDIPAIGAAILLRPTQSLALHLQMIGRALRPAPGKARAIVLDFADNCARHGLPDHPHEWSLESKARRERPKAARALVRKCPECGALNAIRAEACGHCGSILMVRRLDRAEVNIRLKEMDSSPRDSSIAARIRRMTYSERLRWAGHDKGRLRAVARACGYKPGWLRHRLEELRKGAA